MIIIIIIMIIIIMIIIIVHEAHNKYKPKEKQKSIMYCAQTHTAYANLFPAGLLAVYLHR